MNEAATSCGTAIEMAATLRVQRRRRLKVSQVVDVPNVLISAFLPLDIVDSI